MLTVRTTQNHTEHQYSRYSVMSIITNTNEIGDRKIKVFRMGGQSTFDAGNKNTSRSNTIETVTYFASRWLYRNVAFGFSMTNI